MGCDQFQGELDRAVGIEALPVREPSGELARPDPPRDLVEDVGDLLGLGAVAHT